MAQCLRSAPFGTLKNAICLSLTTLAVDEDEDDDDGDDRHHSVPFVLIIEKCGRKRIP